MLSYLLMKTSRNLKCHLDRQLKAEGITSSQFALMNQIEFMDNKALAHQVAEILGYDRPTVSAIIQRLYKLGIIYKTDNPEDKRSHYISLTEEGLKSLDKIRRIADELSEQVFGQLSESDQNKMIDLLNTINEGLDHG